ncbi:hypothetical protein TCEL_00105 [Thermobrachium celere DSM 8682]|uniref:histidine kinase n=2 Tax=Thermobrachium TaxID=150333 RepID=R7RPQ4_9CLOT|nr:hypothetical protein TCEL_00105 [Thermobrachium celere DSM 8682]
MDSWGISILLANITYTLLSIAIILLNKLPENHVAKDRKHFFYIPLVFTAFSLLVHYAFKNQQYVIFIDSNGPTKYCRVLDFTVFALYFYALLTSLKRYKLKPDIYNINSINSIAFAFFSKYVSYFHKYPNDIFAASTHVFKLIAFLFLIKTFVMSNIQKPYKNLEEANTIKTDFLINLSHELRTPVNIILNASRLIYQNPQKYLSYISSIENNAHRLNRLSDNLILFNEIENGNVEVFYSDEDIVYIIDEIIESAEEVLDKKKLDVTFEFSNNRTFVTDKKMFTNIFLNLISNSIKYTNYGGNIHIDLQIDQKLQLCILNDGPPINEDEKHRIFDKFYKSKDSNLPSTEGLGIGLYIAREFVKMLEGEIKIINKDNLTGYAITLPNKKAMLNQQKLQRRIEYSKNYFADII